MATATAVRRRVKSSEPPTNWQCACGAANADVLLQCAMCGGPQPGIPESQAEAARKERAASPAIPSSVETVDLPLDSIDISRLNPRQSFDREALESLGRSLAKRQIEPIAVRRMAGDRYELLWGERRFRAAKLFGLKTLRAEIHECSGQEAVFLRGEENERREALNPIEQAIWYQQLIETGLTQSQVAQMVGCEQAKISTAVGMLKLPAEWQERVIARDITATHARQLLAWKDRPTVLAAIAKDLDERKKPSSHSDTPTGPVGSREFERMVAAAVRKASRTLSKPSWSGDMNGCRFTVTKKLREELDIVQVKAEFGDGTESRAFNTKLWDRLNKEAKAEEAKEAKAEKGTPAPPAESHVPEPWRVKGFLEPWVSGLIAERLKKSDRETVFRLFVVTCAFNDPRGIHLAATGGEGEFAEDTQVWQWLQTLSPAKFDEAMLLVVKGSLTPQADEHNPGYPDLSILVAAAEEIGLDLAAEFVATADMLADYSIDQLQKMPAGKRAKAALQVGDKDPGAKAALDRKSVV